MPGIGSLLAAAGRARAISCGPRWSTPSGCLPFDDAPSVVAWVVTPAPGGSELRQDILHRTFGTVALAGGSPVLHQR